MARKQATFWNQFKVLVWKNVLLKRRNKRQTIQEVLMPIYFIAILALIKFLVKPKTFPELENFPVSPINQTGFLTSFNGRILVAPNTTYTQQVMRKTLHVLNETVPNSFFSVEYYANATVAEGEAIKTFTYGGNHIAAGLIFNFDNSNLSYAIRMPFTEIASTDFADFIHDQAQCRAYNGLDKSGCDVNTYLYTGFSALQVAVDIALMQVNLNSLLIQPPAVNVQMMPKPIYIPDTSYIQILSSIYFVIAYSPFINFLTVNLVAEKERRIREGMKMMGLRDSTFWLSWGFVYAVIITVVTVIVILIAQVSKFFAKSNMLLFFLLLLLYGLSIIGASFSLTPFFNKAQVAGAIASLGSMIISLLYLIVSLTRTYSATGMQYTIPVWCRWLLCLLSPVSLALAIDQGVYLDITNADGMTFSTLTTGDFPLYGPLLMLVVDTVLYFLLAIYLDNVIPGEYGPRYPPCFIFMPSYWCRTRTIKSCSKTSTRSDNDATATEPNVEQVPDRMKDKVAIRLEYLSKQFSTGDKKVIAVNGLSLDIYEDQITAILGHNGAGKTTTMNILTGLTGPTAGSAHIMGLDVSNPQDMSEIRSMTGVCPQHNILFDDLTCLEHLSLFAGIKGVCDDNRDVAIMEALNSVGLAEQKEVRAVNLSGGQKRKLSVAIAIIGDPKIIFLDEPTAGMDPYSRRHLWSVLKEKKKGRVVLLTTHFMDEADILADRKAIINKGSLRCCGSSLFLKNRFGIGYHLNMMMDPGSDVENIKSFVCGYVHGAEINRSCGQEVDLTLPLSQVTNFAGLFMELETKLKVSDNDLHIHSYGISMTTLEEVFLELEKETDMFDHYELGKSTLSLHEDGCDFKSDHVKLSYFENEDKDSVDPAFRILTESELTRQRFKGMLKVRFLNSIRSKLLLYFQLILPIKLMFAGLIVSKISHSKLTGALQIGPYLYSQMQNCTPVYGRFGPIPTMLYNDDVGTPDSAHFIGNLSNIYIMDHYNNTSTQLLPWGPHYIGFNLTKFSITPGLTTGFTVFYNDSAIHSIPAIINLFTNGMFKVEEFLANMESNSSFINTSSFPWGTSFHKSQFNNVAFSSVILLAMAFTLIPGGFGIDVVKDRQTKVRSQLRISGLPYALYWGTYATSDAIKFFIPAVLIIIITFIIKVDSLSYGGAIFTLILICLTYIPANLLLSYVISFAFDKWETAQTLQPLIFFFGGFMPYLPVALIDMMSSAAKASTIHVICCIILPQYTIFGGLYYIDKVYRTADNTSDIKFSDYFSLQILVAIFMPIVHVVINLALLRILDVRNTGGNLGEAFSYFAIKQSPARPIEEVTDDITLDEDDDVRNERQRVRDLMNNQQVPVAIVSSLTKEFAKEGSKNCFKKVPGSTKVVVNNSSFAVDCGEVFGLLGPNGAGKSTTLNMMTADIAPTKGEVIVGGHNISISTSKAYQAIGYCPQYDALWDTITLEEHLECYANIRGIPSELIKDSIDYYLTNLKLNEHKKKRSKYLSGGTKRKLSYCMSMLGKPKVVLLDEPSTGMDPQSKRFLWDTISNSFRGSDRGAILTTHYMEEADALCSRIAIMVNGKLQCIGSSQHLKSKYGGGYLLEIKLQLLDSNGHESSMQDNIARLRRFILEHFPDAICIEEFSERAQYKIPRNNVMSVARAFQLLEEGKQHYGVEEYSFSQSTLEQVFLDFAKRQVDEDTATNTKTFNTSM